MIINNRFDCTPTFFFYGKGKYEVLNDSIYLSFDSIPSLKSESVLDSIVSVDNVVNVTTTVLNNDDKLVDNVTLLWGNPKKKER